MVPGWQQQEVGLVVHELAGAAAMLVGTTLDELAGPMPSADAAQLANRGAVTDASSTQPRLRLLCTSAQAYACSGAGAGARAGNVGLGV